MKLIILSIILALACTAHLAGAEEETVLLDEVVVTATRYEEKVSSVPANVTVITEDDIRHSTARNIPDILRTAPGIHVNDIGGNQRNITVDVRGFGETAGLNTLVLVDGRRVNQADLSGTDWTQIPLERVKKIEIIRGGRGSVLYGDNAAGGVINIITTEGEAMRAAAGTAVGSYDTFKGTASFSNRTERAAYSLTGTYLSSDGYRDNSDTEAKDAGFNISFYPGDAVNLNFSAGYHKDKTGLPGAIKESEFDAGVSRIDSVNPDDFANVEDYYFKVSPEVYFLEDSLLRLDASYRKRAFLTFSTFALGEFTGDTEIKTTALSPQVIFKHTRGDVVNTITAGYDFQKSEEDVLNESLFMGFASTGEFDLEKKSHGYYVHDEIALFQSLMLSGGYRHDRAEFSFRPSTPNDLIIDEDLYTAGVNYTFHGMSYVYGSYSRSFRYPVLDELFSFFTNTIDSDLKSQKSHDYELGVRYYLNERDYLHVNFFRIDTNDEIYFNLATFMNENLDGKSRRDGVEMSFYTEPLEWLALKGNYTWTDASIRGGQYEDSDIPNVPAHKASLGVTLTPVENFTVTINGIHVGKRPFISDFTNDFDEQDDHTVLNAKMQYQWQYVTAYIDLNNMTDEEYSEYGALGGFPTEEAFYPSPEFNVLFGLSVEM